MGCCIRLAQKDLEQGQEHLHKENSKKRKRKTIGDWEATIGMAYTYLESIHKVVDTLVGPFYLLLR